MVYLAGRGVAFALEDDAVPCLLQTEVQTANAAENGAHLHGRHACWGHQGIVSITETKWRKNLGVLWWDVPWEQVYFSNDYIVRCVGNCIIELRLHRSVLN